MPAIPYIGGALGALIIVVISFFLGMTYRRKKAEDEIGSAEEEARRIVAAAVNTAEVRRKETLGETKEEVSQLRTEADQEIKERRSEIQRQENRMTQREENLDRKIDQADKKDETLNEKIKLVEKELEEAKETKAKQLGELEKISTLTTEQAKELLLSELDQALDHEKALRITAFENKLKDDSDQIARELISSAVTRCAADHSSEITVSTVQLPSDEMKGRIIGREGRNIRSIETMTGVDLIIDDTPEAITISSFDPMRREVARIALERLIGDGRIHPARIEEMVERAKSDVEQTMKKEGERAVMEAGVIGINGELVKLLGRLKYRTSYGQNVLNHSLEVAHLTGLMAAELGIDVMMAKRAGLLHDIGKALDHEYEGTHVQIGVDLAKKYKENPQVIHAIEAHHGDTEPTTVIAFLVMAADAISAARPGARRENLESYIKRLQGLEELANSFPGVSSSFAMQAGREVRIMVEPDQVNDDQIVLMARDIVNKIEQEMDYPGQIKVHVIRESRAVDVAK